MRGNRLFSIVYLTNLTKYLVSYLSKYPVKIIRTGGGGEIVLRREDEREHEAATLGADTQADCPPLSLPGPVTMERDPHDTPCPSLVPQVTPNAAEPNSLVGQDSLGGHLHS